MGFRSVCRICLILVATTVLLCALALTVVAGVFPAWHTVDVRSPPPSRYVQFGLWMHCTRPYGDLSDSSLSEKAKETVCDTNKATDDAAAKRLPTQTKMHGWKVASLSLLIAAFAVGILTLLISFCGFCLKWFTIGWALSALTSCVLMVVSLVVYAVNGHNLKGYRIYQPGGANVDGIIMQFGFAFWCGVAAAVLYLFNFVLVLAVVCLSFGDSRRRRADETARVHYSKPAPNAAYGQQQQQAMGMAQWAPQQQQYGYGSRA